VTWLHEGVLTLLRRLAALALLAGALLGALTWVTPASAAPPECTCTTADTEQLARQANDVFTGTVTASTAAPKDDGTQGSVLTHDVTVELVYKGDMREPTVQVRTMSGSPCDLRRLPDGTQYTFFVEVVDEVLVADGCGGTRVPDATLVAELETLYGAGEPPRAAAPVETADIERVPGVEPPMTVTRAAAPGAAMVLVGLLGLVVVRRLGRR
jgi:hypothetical protein